MELINDSPLIRQILKTGYPSNNQCVCPRCGEDIGEYVYITDNGEMCGECFRNEMIDLLNTNPQMLAEAVGIAYRYIG